MCDCFYSAIEHVISFIINLWRYVGTDAISFISVYSTHKYLERSSNKLSCALHLPLCLSKTVFADVSASSVLFVAIHNDSTVLQSKPSQVFITLVAMKLRE